MKPDPSSETPLIFPGSTISGVAGTVTKKGQSARPPMLFCAKTPTKAFGEVAKVLPRSGPQRDAYHQALVDALNRRQIKIPR